MVSVADCISGKCGCAGAEQCKFTRCKNCDYPVDGRGRTLVDHGCEEEKLQVCPDCGGPLNERHVYGALTVSPKSSLTITDRAGQMDSLLRGGRAYQAGKLARVTADVYRNPFRPGTDRWRAWNRGWRETHKRNTLPQGQVIGNIGVDPP